MFPNYTLESIIETLDDTPRYANNGARQVGKSTFCQQLMEEGSFVEQLVTMDDPATFATAKADKSINL